MIDLSRHIEYILLKDNSVNVPGLGTFIATYVPSSWVEDEELLLPPYRSISYSKDFSGDDTFVRSLSAKYNISVQEAGILCMEFVENIFQELHENGTTDIGSIGYFHQPSSEGQMTFVPCQAGVASPSLYGLDAIMAETLNITGIVDNKVEKKSSTGITTEKESIVIRLNRRAINFTASIAASVLLFFLFTSPAFNNYDPETEKATNEILLIKHKTKTAPVVKTVKEKPAKVTKATEPKVESTEMAENVESTNSAAVEEQTPEKVTLQEEYAIVLASALSTKNAERYVTDLEKRGITASIQPTSKYNRVIIRGFATSEEALQRAREMKSESPEFKNIWTKKL